ncbi:MAG TPA: carbohydrate kinase family protein [Candidatus Saccharimonadales bacterium]|nr:carbohydrate kinase family protein [Candidatus Saccharimonadales bacterium]
MTRGRARVTVVGNAVVDVIITREGRFPQLGGAGLNLAMLLALGGATTSLVAAIAADGAARAVQRLAAEVGIELIKGGQSSATSRAIVHLEGGAPSYEFALSVYSPFDFSPPVMRSVAGSDLVVVNAFDYSAGSQVSSLRRLLDACNGWRVVDPNIRPGLLRDPGDAARSLRQLLPAIDILKVSDEDLDHLGETAVQAERAFLSDGVRVLFLTRGAQGAVLHTAEGLRFQAPAQVRPSEMVDTVGAGDASLAALLLGAMAERPDGPGSREALGRLSWGSHLERAMAAAAVACRQRGGPAGPAPDDEALSPAG